MIDCEYINFFVQIYIQWRKEDGYNSSSQTLIVSRLPRLEKLTLSQLQWYSEAQTTTQCFVCRHLQMTVIIWAAEGKENFFVSYRC